MNREQLVARLQEISMELERSAANHNGLLGRLQEAKEMLEKLDAESVPEVQGEVVDAA